MEDLLGYFIEKPRRLISLGQTVFTVGALIIIVGLIGMVARTGVSAIQSLGKAAIPPAQSLAELYPGLWTWWIPETLLGAAPAALLVIAGIWLVLTGRKLQRIYH